MYTVLAFISFGSSGIDVCRSLRSDRPEGHRVRGDILTGGRLVAMVDTTSHSRSASMIFPGSEGSDQGAVKAMQGDWPPCCRPSVGGGHGAELPEAIPVSPGRACQSEDVGVEGNTLLPFPALTARM